MQAISLYNENTFTSAKTPRNINFTGVKEDFGKKISEYIINQDVFVKTGIREANEALKHSFSKAISEILRQENLLGVGKRGAIYSIDDEYALKVLHGLEKLQDSMPIELLKRKFADMKTYLGEDIICIGDFRIKYNAGVHKVSGVPKNVPENEIEEYYQKVHLPRFAKVPQESYDLLAKDLNLLNKKQTESGLFYELDSYNPTNLILVDNKMFLVDEFSETNIGSKNVAGKLVEMLLCKANIDHTIASYGDHVKDAREIFHKIILASGKTFLPLTKNSEDLYYIGKALQNCGVEVDVNNFVGDLVSFTIFHPILPERIKVIEEYLNKIMPI